MDFANYQGVENEALRIAQRLIQIDTTNHGRPGEHIETPAAEYVMDLMGEVGLEPEWIDSEFGRPNIVLRIPGRDRSRGALIMHGHLDVVPAVAEDWSVDPFGGVIKNGYLWGRGAVDMKNMDAMILTVIRDIARTGWVPPRDIIMCMFADEERGGTKGAGWLVQHRPDVFEGATDAISEVGGYNTYVAGKRVYLLQTAEKGLSWYRLKAHGRAGHGSQVNKDNAITKLANAVSAVGNERWPLQLNQTVRELLTGVSELTGIEFEPDNEDSVNALVDALGHAKAYVGATIRTGANPTQLEGGYSVNVIPQSAEGGIDVRPIPGTEEDVRVRIKELLGDVEYELVHSDHGIEVPFEGDTVAAMVDALETEDPGSIVLPYMLSAGTDNKALSKLGIRGYGFSPTRVPEDFDFPAMFHGIDERVPVESLDFGTRVLRRFVAHS